MDLSTLLSSESLLYVVLGVVALLVAILSYFLFKTKPSVEVAPVAVTAVASAVTVAQAVTQPTESLPSTEVVNQMPTVEHATVSKVEVPKGEVPPLSSWKPSQEAAVIPASDDSTGAPSTVGESISSPSTQ